MWKRIYMSAASRIFVLTITEILLGKSDNHRKIRPKSPSSHSRLIILHISQGHELRLISKSWHCRTSTAAHLPDVDMRTRRILPALRQSFFLLESLPLFRTWLSSVLYSCFFSSARVRTGSRPPLM